MKHKIKKSCAAALSAVVAMSLIGCGTPSEPVHEIPAGYDESLRIVDARNLSANDYTVMNVVGEDDFGRKFVSVDKKTDESRYVGMFFFLTLGQHTNHKGIYDISKITQNGKNDENFQVNDRTSPVGAAHIWGEPVWGYYNSTDEWVIRKQVELLTLAGIDFLVLDCSNAVLYTQCTDILFKVLKEYQDDGWRVPEVMYYIANDDGNGQYLRTLTAVYDYFYASDTYRSLWFCPYENKPLITMNQLYYYKGESGNYGLDINDPKQAAMLDLFTFRCRQWPTEPDEEDGIPWMEFEYPQPDHSGWTNVSIAQHTGAVRFSDTISTQGRGYDYDKGINDHDRYAEDINYIAQWQTVLDSKDTNKFTFITGWNEWVAEKMVDSSGEYFTVDTYNAEYSRDIEPSYNLGDNAYLLTCQKIRENNFDAAKHYVYPRLTPDITKDDGEAWAKAAARFKDFTGECEDRNCRGMAGSKVYKDTSGRNDFDTVSVVHDDEYLYFRITTVKDVSQYSDGDTAWMNIWLRNTHEKTLYGGYNYVINRSVSGNKTAVYKAKSGSELVKCGDGDVHVYGNTMIVRVKLSLVGLSSANYAFDFKCTDNISNITDSLSLYNTGDSAPIGRLDYRYGF